MTPTGGPHRGWARRNLAWLLFLLMLAVFAAGRLVGPRIADDQQKQWCAVNVHITSLFGVSLNCDSPEFMHVAAHPSVLLTTVPLIREVRRTVGVVLIVGVMFCGFYVCVGQFQVRLDYAALPPVVTGLGVVPTNLAGRLPATWRRSFGGVCVAVALLALALAMAEGRRVAGDWFD